MRLYNISQMSQWEVSVLGFMGWDVRGEEEKGGEKKR
jgi:hypothetical protein